MVNIGGVLTAWVAGGTAGTAFPATWTIKHVSGQRIVAPIGILIFARTIIAAAVAAEARRSGRVKAAAAGARRHAAAAGQRRIDQRRHHHRRPPLEVGGGGILTFRC